MRVARHIRGTVKRAAPAAVHTGNATAKKERESTHTHTTSRRLSGEMQLTVKFCEQQSAHRVHIFAPHCLHTEAHKSGSRVNCSTMAVISQGRALIGWSIGIPYCPPGFNCPAVSALFLAGGSDTRLSRPLKKEQRGRQLGPAHSNVMFRLPSKSASFICLYEVTILSLLQNLIVQARVATLAASLICTGVRLGTCAAI